MAPRLLEQIDLHGRLVTGDALFAQRGLCQQVIDGGGDYPWVVKKNQPTLYENIDLLFREAPPGEPFGMAEQTGKHGDRVEVRKVWTSTALEGYLDWPGARQVCKIQREVVRKGKKTVEVRFGLTSLGADRVDAARLLKEVRGHWAIENRLHYVRDVTMGEDASQVRTGSAPQVMAALRNTVLARLRRAAASGSHEHSRRAARGWLDSRRCPPLPRPASPMESKDPGLAVLVAAVLMSLVACWWAASSGREGVFPIVVSYRLSEVVVCGPELVRALALASSAAAALGCGAQPARRPAFATRGT